MRLLLTRAAPDAARTKATLEAMGHTVLVSPVIEMVATGAVWPVGVVDAVAATSAQAFTMLTEGPAPEARRVMPLFLVGEETASAALARGFSGATTVARTAADLVEAAVPGNARRAVYLAGRDRKPDLELGLRAKGAILDVVEVYEARAATALTVETARALAEGAIDGVLHYSRRSADLFRRLAGDAAVVGLDHYALSEDAATPLREAGCAVRTAAKPTGASLLRLIEKTGA